MNTRIFLQKPALTVFIASAAIVAASGAAWAETNDNVRGGSERDRVATAAVDAAGGGTAVDVERSDDLGEAYEVEVRKKDGTEVDVALDKNLKVVHRERDDADDNDLDDNDDNGDRSVAHDNDDNPGVSQGRYDGDDADERALTAGERAAVSAAAVKAIGSGTVTDIEASDDLGTAFEAEVTDRDGAQWDVELDTKYAVVSKSQDD